MIIYPTNYDIYIEKDGIKVAIVCSYTAKRDGQYIVKLNHVYLTDEAVHRNIDIFELKNFNFIIKKHDRIIKYTGCDWCLTHEDECMANIGIDKIKLIAKNRKESS